MTEETRLGDAVRLRLDDLGQTQTWLGERMGELHGRRPYGQSTVGTWMARTEPTPELVFDLDLPPPLAPLADGASQPTRRAASRS